MKERNNKKLVIGIITIIFIGVSGVLYSLGADKTAYEENFFLEHAELGETKQNQESVTQTDKQQNNQSVIQTDKQDNKEVTEYIYVHLCGEVKKPDVYKVLRGTRLQEVVKNAGGFTTKAAKDDINQAQIVEDGERIYIPSVEEAKENMLSEEAPNNNLVNINTCTREELMTLPGIGSAKADKIIAFREENGGFKSPQDLTQINGIKEGVFQKLKDFIRIN